MHDSLFTDTKHLYILLLLLDFILLLLCKINLCFICCIFQYNR